MPEPGCISPIDTEHRLTAFEGKSALNSFHSATPTEATVWRDTKAERQDGIGRERERKGGRKRNAALFLNRAHIFGHKRIGFIFAERDGSGDHNAFEKGDATEKQRELDYASKRGFFAVLFLYDEQDILMLKNWRLTTLRRRDVLQLPEAVQEDEYLPWRRFSLVICSSNE